MRGPTKSKLYPNIIFTLNKKSTGQFQISPHHYFLSSKTLENSNLSSEYHHDLGQLCDTQGDCVYQPETTQFLELQIEQTIHP